MTTGHLDPNTLKSIVHLALTEDIGSGDATTLAVVPAELRTTAHFVARKACVCSGLPVVQAVFAELDPSLTFTAHVADGDTCPAGTDLATIAGNARAILTGERVALNFIQRMSGIATMTHRYVEALGPSKTVLLDTRKTTPGLRMLEKYSVLMGGAQNHRIGLYDRIMIKDNHRELARRAGGSHSIEYAVKSCREKYPNLEIEVEADSMADVVAAAEAGVEYILLDNMTNEQMAEAIRLIAGRAKTEASGNITLERLPSLAHLGLDFVSSGALTHSAPAVDIGLDIL